MKMMLAVPATVWNPKINLHFSAFNQLSTSNYEGSINPTHSWNLQN